jgi:hypothetical protein
MSWFVLLYNRVRDVITLTVELGKDDGVPDHIFAELKVNGELDGYFVYIRTDDKEVWGKWKKKEGRWDTPQKVPDVVKLWRLVTT